MHRTIERGLLKHFALRMILSQRNMDFGGRSNDRRGASFDISFSTDTVIPRRSIPSSCALIPMVVVMQVPRAVATRSVGENASPLPLLSVGASVVIFDCDSPCVASQCKSRLYLISTLTRMNYEARFVSCHVEQDLPLL